MKNPTIRNTPFLIGLVFTSGLVISGQATAVTGDFKNTDFAAAAPFTYDHATGGGAYNDRTVGDNADITEQLEGGQFSCGDVISYLAQIEMESAPVDSVQTGRFNFSFLGNSTGQAGAAHSEVLDVSINYGQVENGETNFGTGNPGEGFYGLDSGVSDDGGSSATLIRQGLTGELFTSGTVLELTVDVDDLEAGEKVVLRIDTKLSCKSGSSPTGNLQGAIVDGITIEASREDQAINTGNQTIPFLKIGDIAGAGEPLLLLEKTVTTASGQCGTDDVEELTVTAGDTVKYCYAISNPGTSDLYAVSIVDDNGTAGDESDDFTINTGNLSSGTTKTVTKLITLDYSGTVVNTADATGNNGLNGGQYAELSASDIATVQVTAVPNRPPVANDDNISADENGTVLINPASNDTDPDNNLDNTVTIVSEPTNGTLTNNDDGSYTYTADDGYSGEDSFIYEVCDTEGLCSQATVTIVVNSTANPPVANNDNLETSEDTAATINVVINDTDVDGNLDATSATLISQTTNGIVVNNDDGTFTYTPNEDYFGIDSFSYQICDTTGLCSIAVVDINVTAVNDAPIAEDDSVSTDEDKEVIIHVANNDSDIDNNLDTSSATVTTEPSNGSVTKNDDGTFTYTPDDNFNGMDSFYYSICDTDGLCDIAEVIITVNPVNDAPVALNESVNTDEDVAVTIAVKDNDNAGPTNEDQTLTIKETSSPTNGTAVINDDGTVTYMPNTDYNGTDSFTYTVCDTDALCATATVTIGIASLNDAPVATDDNVTLNEDESVTINVLNNDNDVDGNLDPSSVKLVGNGPGNGSVVVNNDGTFTYTPNANFNGTDSFTYEVCDTEGMCVTAIVTVNVLAVNDAPVALDDSYITQQDVDLIDSSLLDNDSDVDGDELVVNFADTTSQYGGLVNVNSDGSFEYSPTSGFAGYDTFTYQACDIEGLCDTAMATIEVQAKNNRSISVDLQDFTSNGSMLSGSMLISNQSGGYDVQVIDMDIRVQYRSSEVKQWTSVEVLEASCTFNPSATFSITDTKAVSFIDCTLAEDITADATVRVTANVQIYGRIKGKKTDGWYLNRLSN